MSVHAAPAAPDYFTPADAVRLVFLAGMAATQLKLDRLPATVTDLFPETGRRAAPRDSWWYSNELDEAASSLAGCLEAVGMAVATGNLDHLGM